jgi:hypothetical protein
VIAIRYLVYNIILKFLLSELPNGLQLALLVNLWGIGAGLCLGARKPEASLFRLTGQGKLLDCEACARRIYGSPQRPEHYSGDHAGRFVSLGLYSDY